MKKQLSERGVFERKVSENDVLEEIMIRLSANGARVNRIVERIPWGRTTSTPGIPDLVFWFRPGTMIECPPGIIPVRPPVFGFIEVKKPGGLRRPAQLRWILEAQNDGVIAFFAESWADCVSEFKKHGVVLK